MFIYEVNLTVALNIQRAFEQWLPGHIKEVVEKGRFQRARWYYEKTDGKRIFWVVHYEVETQESLDKYLLEHAPNLRQDALSRFGVRFQASRRTLKPITEISS